MSKLHLDMYSALMKEVSANLRSEIEELSKKVKQARESENWGTYKNLILAYKEVFTMYNDIAIDVCERDMDKTQYVQTTVSLDRDTTGIVAKVIEGILPANRITTKSKIANLFDKWDRGYIETQIEDDSLIMKANMSKLLSRRLISCNDGTLINVSGFRGVGKTYELIKFAKDFNYLVIVPNEYIANEYRKDFDYSYIYSQKSNLLDGIEIKDCVVDEGVDIQRIKDLGLNVITGYINK